MAMASGEKLQLATEIQFVKGVGPKLAPLFQKLGIHTAKDLLLHVPRRYEDRTNLPAMRSIRPGDAVTLRGEVTHVEMRPQRGRVAPTRVTLSDGTSQVTLVWFNRPWIAAKLRAAEGDVLVYGVVRESGRGAYEIHNPDYEIIDPEDDAGAFASIVPVYPATEGLNQAVLRRAARGVAERLVDHVPDPLPESILRRLKMLSKDQALRQIHRPETLELAEQARSRLAFDELLATQLLVQLRRAASQQEPGIAFPISDLKHAQPITLLAPQHEWAEGETLWDEVKRMLPFELTGAQKRVVGEIWHDMEKPVPMNRLVQGDVGSGKTAVAACAILAAVRCGYQAALMAPTEILAEQHAYGLAKLFEPLGIPVATVLGKQTARERKKAVERLKSGEAAVAVGTHALIQDGTEFSRLGLCVIDEQHRFGVRQRLALRQKSSQIPDVLVMTATPIPRTLTMTFYGDLDVSIIDELPPGRKPIKTHWKKPDERPKVYEIVRELVKEGRQAYFVCPAIEESEKLQTQAAQDLFYRLQETVFSDLRVGLLHGQMKAVEKEEVMDRFRKHELDILVATVVIEVGVDVPNATVMVIEDAGRFGLSQLHQLRGRVGRGSHQSFCILIAGAGTGDARERMETLVMTQDGFRIAEVDLKLRGPGDLLGTAQSGALDFKLADLNRDFALLEQARNLAAEIVRQDPDLTRSEHAGLAEAIQSKREDDAWISVS